ncbi:MAG: NAD(P)-dependent oxidoreductase [Verrucomicrobiaceae bacterium]|nr:NAD(P)-dependent oxidoreductase [Verrucomicrobiaceae bacterium]
MMNVISNVDELDEVLSRPTDGAREAMRRVQGDVILLGAGGKMGPTLARMARRALDETGQTQRRVLAVSRFSSRKAAEDLQRHGVETISADLLNPAEVAALPLVPNVFFMAGQKFGTQDAPELTWAMNTLVPAHVAEHYKASRMVVFSTGCVYPLMPADGRGATEDDPLTPPGEYANSCVGRERLFGHFAKKHGTALLYFRLCYAIDLRYGVLHDVARKVLHDEPVDVTMGVAHVIWQGDANARALQSLELASSPPRALNVTGLERVRIRELAAKFGKIMGREPIFTGAESPMAWIWDASRSYEAFGAPTVSLEEMIQATSDWLMRGGETLNKPTHFEVTSGNF